MLNWKSALFSRNLNPTWKTYKKSIHPKCNTGWRRPSWELLQGRMKQRSTQNSLKGKLNTPLQQLPTTAKVVMAGTMGTSTWQMQKDCDQAEPSSKIPNFHAARENKFQSEGVPPKPSTWSSIRDEQLHEKRWEGSVPDVAAAQGEGETKVFFVPDWSHGAAPENYGGEVIINSHTHTWVSFYIESEKRVDDIFQHCSKNADLCLILFWNLIDSLKENLIYSLMFFWLIRTYSFRIPQISGQTVSEFFFGNIFTPG